MADAVEPIRSSRSTIDRRDRIGVRIRRGVMCLLAAIVVLALANLVGQRATTAHATSSLARIDLRGPSTVRPGLLFQTTITVSALEVLPHAQLVLSSGWVDGMTLNTIEPSASTEHSGPDGSLVFDIGTLRPSQPYVQYLEFQVNPTSLSRRSQVVTILSDSSPIVTLHRTMSVVP